MRIVIMIKYLDSTCIDEGLVDLFSLGVEVTHVLLT